MATTSYGVNDTLAVKLWSKSLSAAERDSLEIDPLMGEDVNSIIQIKTETAKGPGDKVTFGLRTRLTGDGKTENETLEGNGEGLTSHADAIYINMLRHAVGVKAENSIDQQRVPFNLRDEAKSALTDWWADRKSVN